MTDFGYFQVTTFSRRQPICATGQASLPMVMASLPGLGRFGMVGYPSIHPSEEIAHDFRSRPTTAADPH
jgi:hypothetical protein